MAAQSPERARHPYPPEISAMEALPARNLLITRRFWTPQNPPGIYRELTERTCSAAAKYTRRNKSTTFAGSGGVPPALCSLRFAGEASGPASRSTFNALYRSVSWDLMFQTGSGPSNTRIIVPPISAQPGIPTFTGAPDLAAGIELGRYPNLTDCVGLISQKGS